MTVKTAAASIYLRFMLEAICSTFLYVAILFILACSSFAVRRYLGPAHGFWANMTIDFMVGIAVGLYLYRVAVSMMKVIKQV